MSSSSNISQSGYSPSEPETPQSTPQTRIQNYDQSLNHGDLGHSFEQSLKNVHKEIHQKRIQALRKELDYLKSTEWKFEYDKDDDEKENFLANELFELELQAEKETLVLLEPPITETPRNAACFQKTGLITECGDDFIIIDGSLCYNESGCSLNLKVNDRVLYLGYKDDKDTVIVVRVLENQGLYWGDAEDKEEQTYDVIEHILIGQVEKRENRLVYLAESDLKFNLDDVEGPFVPICGDWLELKCSVQQDEKKLSDISSVQVLKVISFNYIRMKIKSAIVTVCSQTYGICDRQIYYDNSSLTSSVRPNVGSKVLVEAIESNQGSCNWRAIKLKVLHNNCSPKKNPIEVPNEEEISLNLEKEKKINITHPLKFNEINLQETEKIKLNITNKSNQLYVINKWIILSKKCDSQINIKPFINQPVRLESGQTFQLSVSCNPKFLGKSRECLVILFKGFQFKRFIDIHIIENIPTHSNFENGFKHWKESQKIEAMRKVKGNNDSLIPGVRPCKTPHFVSVKIGIFPIPEKIWAIVLGDSDQMVYTNEFDKILNKIETHLPFLAQELNIANYLDKWHALLYMEEVQANLNMRVYDRSKVYLIRCDEYLGVEIEGLAERRPSLIVGDKVIVKDMWSENDSQFEGFIHTTKGNLVLVKFNSQFHESYNGNDVSVEFHFGRAVYRRSHHAINLALSNLGPDILFPSRIITKPPQVSSENIEKVTWFNTNLNNCQKNAIFNILKGECRPMPYIIFGPPGTGKTITVIETILQILTLYPESRVLVATPSNSASNLITERLIKYKASFSGSIVRLIANYLIDSENIPEPIRPYCATLDIATENTAKSNHTIKNKMKLNCRKNYIGRHRVTIGTCYSLGALIHIGLPQGHFTHVIIDEAGQATEPEIMVPMSFIDKRHGQIILAGDPMQLGPIIMSRYCNEYGMGESFLCRLLERFPYLKDYASFTNGFDIRLVTRLNDNYRSLKEVIELPSEIFYDGSLVAKIDKSLPWTSKYISAVCDVFESQSNSGGIFIYGIKGTNLRSEENPSWYNPQEASMLALTVCKLYKKSIKAHDIGIITPYIAQTKYFRVLFESMGLPQPKIGTVEEFQGQERPIILISTVRSTNSLLEEDVRHFLGFVKSPKRLNVALTRAKIAVILFCNPHLLSTDSLWNKVIMHAVSSEKYMGCDLPLGLHNILNNNVNVLK